MVPTSVESHWLGTRGPRPSCSLPLGCTKVGKSPEKQWCPQPFTRSRDGEQRWACGAGWHGGWGTAERDPDSLPPSSPREDVCCWPPDSPELQAEAGGLQGVSRESVEGAWGTLSPKTGLWSPRAGRRPPPASGPGGAVTQELDGPTQLQARPPPPSEPKLSPRLGRPGPSPTRWPGLGSLQGGSLRLGGGGAACSSER